MGGTRDEDLEVLDEAAYALVALDVVIDQCLNVWFKCDKNIKRSNNTVQNMYLLNVFKYLLVKCLKN